MDYQDRAKSKIDKILEVVWQGCKSLGPCLQVASALGRYAIPNYIFHDATFIL